MTIGMDYNGWRNVLCIQGLFVRFGGDQLSIFEIIMLTCFGFAWPISIHKSWTSKSTGGKSPVFSYVIIIGYLSGMTHKWLNSRDLVMVLYAINMAMVTVDLMLYYRNKRLEDAAKAAKGLETVHTNG
ncbi:hypothetical protein SAMN03080599_03382 [Acidaminobacter hydrogenoformans DSM 2784]|uniref:PQ loop repeat-containing protein n=1 Tax=Acidaminobacter hydrogenoformans DSM 2784 TaxID=1120920 RepID=A0A1G5S718_9FIRM|nr:hypothetical protein SAMN03080599_03382 [Acidaminobacter hydrogenoformans DSM 2784]